MMIQCHRVGRVAVFSLLVVLSLFLLNPSWTQASSTDGISSSKTYLQWEPWMGDPELPRMQLLLPGGETSFDELDFAFTEAEIQSYREDLAYMLGVDDLFAVPLESRPPLNPVITGEYLETDFTIYKLYYESVPGYYVPVNLYVPDPVLFPSPRPAVICPHGHWDGDKHSRQVQVRAQGLAKLGYVVLAYDVVGVGERRRGSVSEGHEELSAMQAYPGGPLAMGQMAYEVSRAIDYLETRPDIADLTHLAVTGSSGGGSQTIYSTALDDRIEVAVPVCFGGMAHWHPFGTGDEIMPLFHRFFPERNYLYPLMYPAKVMFVADRTNDSNLINHALNTYDNFGVSDTINFTSMDSEPHDYLQAHREWMYAWLSRWVLGVNVGDTLPDPPGISDEMDLIYWEDLLVGLPATKNTFVETCDQLRQGMPGYTLPVNEQEWVDRRQSMKDSLQVLMNTPSSTLYHDIIPGNAVDNPELIKIQTEDLTLEFVLSESYTWESWVDVALYKPSASAPWPCIVLLNPLEHPGDNDTEYLAVYDPIDDSALIASLVSEGYAVMKVTMRFNDIPDEFPDLGSKSDLRYEVAATRSLDYNDNPLFGRHVFDASVLLTYLESRSDIHSDRVSVWGMGEGANIAITASAMDTRVCQCVSQSGRSKFGVAANDRHPGWSYPPRFLKTADVQHIASIITPRRLVVANSTDDARISLTGSELAQEMEWATESYLSSSASSELYLLTGVDNTQIIQALDPTCSPDEETGIELVSFTALEEDATAVLEWETATESGNAGFRLWRSDDASNEYELITQAMIPAEGSETGGAEYYHIDDDVEAGATYWYKLEAVDIFGESQYHGPVSITLEEEPPMCGINGGSSSGAACMLMLLFWIALRVRSKRFHN